MSGRMEAVLQTENVKPLDWESLGRLVRRCALDAVALHFAALADEQHRGMISDKALSPTEGARI